MSKLFAILLLLLSILLLTSCTKDEGTTINEPYVNTAPSTPGNPNPPDGATRISRSPVLNWTCADPDAGDTIKYDLYFGSVNPPNSLMASSWIYPNYNASGLDSNKTYYWRVTAKDSKGGQSIGSIWRFTTIGTPTIIPMELSNWRYWASNPDQYKSAGAGIFETTSEGLKAYGQPNKRDGINIHPINKYDMMNKTLYCKWKINGGGEYCNGGFIIMLDDSLPATNIYGAGSPGFVGFVFVTTYYSYNGSTLIQDDVWYYTRVIITSTGFTSKTSTTNYDNSGGTVIQTISNNVSATTLIGKPVLGIGDTYAGSSAYTVVAEFSIE